ncbi:MAG: amino acid ABC transporter permease [Pedococcus sp.]
MRPAPTGPQRAASLQLAGAAMVLVTIAAAVGAASMARVASADGGSWQVIVLVWCTLLVGSALAPLVYLIRAQRERRLSAAGYAVDDGERGRLHAFRSAGAGWTVLGACLPVLFLAGFTAFLSANDHAVQTTFFDWAFMQKSSVEVAKAFRQNILIALVAEVLVLVWGLVVAVARLAPGPAGRPIRWLATAYVDMFRAVPAIIVIYLIGFGLPLAGVPLLSDLSPMWAAVLALTLTYGAYVAEVYRSGIESIHWSQVAAARSLGLSYGKTLRHVVVPQAVRRVTPPLLNDFIGLQKDTALVTVIGTVDAFTQAKIYASNYFNLSSVTVVAVLFVLVTIPQTRFVDRMLARDASRQRARS